MTFHTLNTISMIWGLSEMTLALIKRAGAKEASGKDKSSLPLLWVAVTLSIFGGLFFATRHLAPMPFDPTQRLLVAAILFFGGVALRLTAILTLRKYFTVNVAIREGHELITHGIYSIVRHPAYSGILLSFTGWGLALGDWLSLACASLPMLATVAYRIRVEERALIGAFGEKYVEYSRRTKRLVPFVF